MRGRLARSRTKTVWQTEGRRGGHLGVFPCDLDDTDVFVCEFVEEGRGHVYREITSRLLAHGHYQTTSRRTEVTGRAPWAFILNSRGGRLPVCGYADFLRRRYQYQRLTFENETAICRH